MGHQGKVLVIDDDPDFLDYTRIVLESEGYEVHTADSAGEGLLAIQQFKPDLVILDVMLSYSLDGLNVTKKMYDDPELRKIPLIIVSAIVDSEEMEQKSKDEFVYNHFMPKPILPQELVKAVEKLLN